MGASCQFSPRKTDNAGFTKFSSVRSKRVFVGVREKVSEFLGFLGIFGDSFCRSPFRPFLKFIRGRPGKPNQKKGQNEKFMNFAHFCEFWCFSLGKQARFTLNFCSGMPLRKVHELPFLWFGLPGPLLILETFLAILGLKCARKMLLQTTTRESHRRKSAGIAMLASLAVMISSIGNFKFLGWGGGRNGRGGGDSTPPREVQCFSTALLLNEASEKRHEL